MRRKQTVSQPSKPSIINIIIIILLSSSILRIQKLEAGVGFLSSEVRIASDKSRSSNSSKWTHSSASYSPNAVIISAIIAILIAMTFKKDKSRSVSRIVTKTHAAFLQ
jgi:hypothetical protein